MRNECEAHRPSSTDVRVSDPLRFCSVAGFGKRDKKSVFPLALPLRYARAVERGEKLEPPLDPRIVVSQLDDAFDSIVVRIYAKLHTRKVSSMVFDDQDKATSF